MLAGYNSPNEAFEQVKEELDRLREPMSGYETEKENLEKTLQENKVTMNAVTRFILYTEGYVICLETEKNPSMKKLIWFLVLHKQHQVTVGLRTNF